MGWSILVVLHLFRSPPRWQLIFYSPHFVLDLLATTVSPFLPPLQPRDSPKSPPHPPPPVAISIRAYVFISVCFRLKQIEAKMFSP